jgi:hypothetical protein
MGAKPQARLVTPNRSATYPVLRSLQSFSNTPSAKRKPARNSLAQSPVFRHPKGLEIDLRTQKRIFDGCSLHRIRETLRRPANPTMPIYYIDRLLHLISAPWLADPYSCNYPGTTDATRHTCASKADFIVTVSIYSLSTARSSNRFQSRHEASPSGVFGAVST